MNVIQIERIQSEIHVVGSLWFTANFHTNLDVLSDRFCTTMLNFPFPFSEENFPNYPDIPYMS